MGRELHVERNAEIRRRAAAGESYNATARVFRLDPTRVSQIVRYTDPVWQGNYRARARQRDAAYKRRRAGMVA